MSCYIIAQLTFTRREIYDRYQARFAEVFRRFDGRLLAADEAPALLEGHWRGDKVVVLEFPDEAAALTFQSSPDYAEIAIDRKAGASAVVLMVKGVGSRSPSPT